MLCFEGDVVNEWFTVEAVAVFGAMEAARLLPNCLLIAMSLSLGSLRFVGTRVLAWTTVSTAVKVCCTLSPPMTPCNFGIIFCLSGSRLGRPTKWLAV